MALEVDLRPFRKDMKTARAQVPYAISLALTATAGHIGIGWQEEMAEGLDRPTPFTLNSVAVRPARKSTLIASVYVKDIAAEYLEPFVFGGSHALGKKVAILAPKNVGLNAYGNLARNKVAQLKGKSNTYVGALKTRSGQVINGVWQRPTKSARKRGPAGLKLLVRFSDPLPVTQELRFIERAQRDAAVFAPEFAKALAKAIATAR